jgi:hypothetical protein
VRVFDEVCRLEGASSSRPFTRSAYKARTKTAMGKAPRRERRRFAAGNDSDVASSPAGIATMACFSVPFGKIMRGETSVQVKLLIFIEDVMNGGESFALTGLRGFN